MYLIYILESIIINFIIRKVKTLYNKVREIDLVRFTHHNSSVLCVTKKEPFEIFYWSLHDN